jgi:hypothetical protein
MPKRWVHWVGIAAVVLMIASMVMYVMTLDEAEQPGDGMQETVPADAAP